MKAKIMGFVFFVAILLMILAQCQRDKRAIVTTTEKFKKLSRLEQVKMCGECHKQIYENEMKGPHANSYKNFLQHQVFVNSKVYDCKEYREQVNEAKDICVSCHTGANLFETVFKNISDETELKKIETPSSTLSALGRDSTQLLTGVDCITCHFNGNNVITTTNSPSYKTLGYCPDFCRPVKSALFTSNNNCYPCHQEQVQDMDRLLKMGSVTNTQCNSCHEEHDTNNNLTHYTYWAKNPLDKKLPSSLNIFNGITATYSVSSNAIRIVWKNSLLPHTRSVCTELLAVMEITQNGKKIKQETIRLNRKTEHDKQLWYSFKDKPVPGILGTEFSGINDSIVRYIPVPAQLKGNINVQITGYKKEQYWLHDSICSVYFQKKVHL